MASFCYRLEKAGLGIVKDSRQILLKSMFHQLSRLHSPSQQALRYRVHWRVHIGATRTSMPWISNLYATIEPLVEPLDRIPAIETFLCGRTYQLKFVTQSRPFPTRN